MHIHFTEEELADRRRRACEAMQHDGLDGLLVFRQESMYWLTGYDTFGFVWFQCLYLGADGEMFLLTRAPDLRQAQFNSVIPHDRIHIWKDREGADPVSELKALLETEGCRSKKLGVEWESYGLNARNGFMVRDAMDGFATLEDASFLVSRLRLVKSPAELDYARKAAELADASWDEAVRLAKPGAFEGDILAAMQGAIFAGGGDYPGNEFIIGSGPGALLCRYYSGRRHLDAEDQLTLEWAGVERHYHAAMMRTLRVDAAPPRQIEMHQVARDALLAVEEALRPGRPLGEAFDAHARTLDAAGYQAHRLNACGYSMGTTFSPNWMDWPMLYGGNPVEAAPGMAFFVHIIIFDSERGLAMTLGRTSLIAEAGAEPLSAAALDPIVA
ncbi:MAG: aminopeptidase P family protein [Alphaproteobacteria bacterium]|nr:aminopeptidase P family protein [Alphaproteobacteria bacterium]